MCCTLCLKYSSTPKGVLEYPSVPLLKVPQPLASPHRFCFFVMAADPPRRLMRKHKLHGELPVYYGGREDSKDVDYENDSDFSESSAASSAASAEEQKLREEQQAAETVRSPTFFPM